MCAKQCGAGDGDLVREEVAYRTYAVMRGWQHAADDAWVKKVVYG